MSVSGDDFAGYDSDLDLKADQRGRIIGSSVAIFIITDLFVLLRLISRKKARAGYWWDDVLALLAMLMANALCIIWFCELRNGYGRHIFIYAPPERMYKEIRWRKAFFVFELFFHTAITICKFSVLAFYYRIFPYRTFRNVLLVVAALSLGYGISIDVSILFQCRPLHYQWDLPNPNAHGTCVNFHAFFVGKGIANVLLNVIIFALPIPLLWRLRVTLRQQVILTSIFTLAGFVIIVSIIWIIVVPDVTTRDITWDAVDFGIWSTLEPNIAVICACIPSLRPLVTILRNGVFQHPLIKKSLHSANLSSVLSSKPGKLWPGVHSAGKDVSASSDSDGRFNRLDEMDDLRPYGHVAGARAASKHHAPGSAGGDVPHGAEYAPGRGHHGHHGHGHRHGSGGDLEMSPPVPQGEIAVKTDVTVEMSERLPYNDRLY